MNRDVYGICWCPYDDNGACGCKSLDEAMQQPRAMAQAYEAGYNAGVAHEREACAKVCDDLLANPRNGGGWSDATIEAAAAIRARGEQP